jgi:hypothetical protein
LQKFLIRDDWWINEIVSIFWIAQERGREGEYGMAEIWWR